MQFRNYEFTVKHDHGTQKLRVYARNFEAGKKMICDFEGCPPCAIIAQRVIPTAKQIAKTKSLLRGL